jgi:hypothetical protein
MHDTLVKFFAEKTLGVSLPKSPDLGLIRSFEDELIRSVYAFHSDASLCLSASNLNDPSFALETNVPLGESVLQTAQRCLYEIQRYLNDVFSLLDALDFKHNCNRCEFDPHCATAFAVASALLATHDKHINSVYASIPIVGLRVPDWRQLFINDPKSKKIAFGLNGTHKNLSLLLPDDELLSDQDGQCMGCGEPIYGNALYGLVKKRNYRRCTFTDALFCKQWCHKNDKHALPMNMLWNLDETEYSVSRPAYALIRNLWDKPLIPFAKIHPDVVKRAPGILSMQQERVSIMKRMRSILRCKESFHSSVEKTIGIGRLYMCFTADLFSFADLSPSAMQETLSSLQLFLKTSL